MKIKPQYFVLVVVLFVGGVLGMLFFTSGNMGDLFSQSVNPVADNSTAEGADPRPVTESLDTQSPEQSSVDTEKLIQELQQELLLAENDPDKAIELRRRIQLLKTEKQEITTTEADSL